MAKKKVQDQGERILRIEAYIRYAAMTKNEAQRRYGAYYEDIRLKNSEMFDGKGIYGF